MGLVTVTKQFTVPAGSTTTGTIYTVTAGKQFKLDRVEIWFPPGSESELRVMILHGVSRVVPEEGYVVGDGETFTFKTNVVYGSQEEVKTLLMNTSSTTSHDVQITIEGVEE